MKYDILKTDYWNILNTTNELNYIYKVQNMISWKIIDEILLVESRLIEIWLVKIRLNEIKISKMMDDCFKWL